MRIIEFNGLPGCGKTTISRALYASISERGLRPVYYNDIRLKLPSGVWKKGTYILRHWNLKEVLCLRKIAKCFKKIPFKEKWTRILYTEQIASNYRAFRSKEGICIADQGLLQGIVSIGYTHDFISNSTQQDFIKHSSDFLSPYYRQMLIINVQVAPEESLIRLRSREKNYGRFDDVASDSALLSGLEKQKLLFQLLWEGCLAGKSNVISISSTNNPDGNVGIILGHISEKDC